MKKSWEVAWVFILHVAIATSIFLIISLGAVLLSVYVERLKKDRVDDVLIVMFKSAEYATAAIDLLLYVIFLGRAGYNAVKEFW